jgi:hypothetical protein
MEIASLVENAVLADLELDPKIAVWNPLGHDEPGAKGGEFGENDDRILLIVVSAENRGDFDGVSGAGLKIVAVEIELTQNVGINSDTTVLSDVHEKIEDRLPATHIFDNSRHLAFSSSRLKVYGIMAAETERTEDIDQTRQRIVTRQFLCAQVS